MIIPLKILSIYYLKVGLSVVSYLVDHFLSLSNPCQWLCVKYWVG